MLKLLIFRRLFAIGAFTIFGAFSFFAFTGIQYQGLKLASIEKERLYYFSDLKERKKEWSLSLLRVFEGNLKESLSQDTSINPSVWSESNPAFGQCAVTALIVQHFFGGEIIEAEIPQEWQITAWFSSHLWNRIGGQDIDFTKEQFPPNFPYDDLINGRLGAVRPIEKGYLLADQNIADNYERAMNRLEKTLF